MLAISSLLTFALATFTVGFPSLVGGRSFEVKREVNLTAFEHEATGSKLSYVTNSGVCETTPGVNQYSGYLTVGNNMSMWFWLFEARNNPSTAPLVAWLTGGPGCSSLVGLFQENGPCTFNNVSGSTPVLNPYSWNNVANMVYIDQPIGTGFSYGTESTNSTPTAAHYVWIFLQAFYAQFPIYENRNFGLATESYGGHYGPDFVSYFESQNTAIDQGSVVGVKISVIALIIGNGWVDPNVQFKAQIDYAARNPYRTLINESQVNAFYQVYDESCGPALNDCSSSDSNDACANAAITCLNNITAPISENFDIYDIVQTDYAFPPATYVNYLQDSEIQARIGAHFINSGDYARSFLAVLSDVVQSGLQVLLMAGDRDWICNTDGVQAVIAEMEFDQSTELNSAPLIPYTVGGVQYGTYKTAGNFTFVNVFEAGHQVPSYQPAFALQAFTQTINQQTLSST
ncbi:putative carboxypeptidase S1 [Lactarius quietus]|nr:putative carboxypeptidase S1 [Lactarius quietus]